MATNPYHVRLAISQYGEQFRAELFTEDLGDTDGDLLPADWKEQFDRWMTYLQGGGDLRANADAEVGGQLFEWVFGRGVNRSKWDEILRHLERQPGRPLRLLIDTSALGTVAAPDRDRDRIHNLPYGLLFDPQGSYFLFRPGAGRPPVQFVRIIRRCSPRQLNLNPMSRPVRLLLAAAEPDSADVPPFGCAGRLRRLAGGLARMPAAFELFLCTPGGVRPMSEALPGLPSEWQDALFEPLCRTTRAVLKSALAAGNFDVLHLMAHGRDNGVLLGAEGGGADHVTALNLKEWCGQSRLQMAFLQVCKAGRTGGRGAFGGLAQELLNPRGGNLAAVVASPYPLDAGPSTEASLSFYQRLAEGKSPDEALPRGLDEDNWAWAFLELWVRPRALEGTGSRGAYQFVSPYRGLASFQERDADIFCGRDAEVAELLQLLRGETAVSVVGDSGSGKSSLLQAGLAYSVRRDGLAGQTGWRIVSLRPGGQPARSLMGALLLGSETAEDLPADLRERVRGSGGDSAGAPTYEEWLGSLQALLRGECRPGRPLLLLFDQFEEMFTLCKDEAQRRAVAGVLAAAVRDGAGHFRLVLGMRSDYLGTAATLPDGPALLGRPWVLRPPGGDDLERVVGEPARRCSYEFEGSSPAHPEPLLRRILSDPLLAAGAAEAGESGDAPGHVVTPLPLLEFALERLWLKAVERGTQEFRHEDYDQVGGLEGAIATHADEVYDRLVSSPGLGAEGQKVAENLFTRLVSQRGTRRPHARADLETGPRPDLVRRVIDYLVGERLLTVRATPAGLEAQVDLAHEVLIRRWKKLATWLSLDPSGRAIREAFEDDARKWLAGGGTLGPRNRANRPTAEKATLYLAWLATSGHAPTPDQAAFAGELRALLRERARGRVAAVAVAVLVAVVLTGLWLWADYQRGQAEYQGGEAEKARLREVGEADNARQSSRRSREASTRLAVGNGIPRLDEDDLPGALLWFTKALQINEGNAEEELNHRIRIGSALKQLPSLRHVWRSDDDTRHAEFSPDGRRLLITSFEAAMLWDPVTGRPLLEAPVPCHAVVPPTFSSDGARVLVADSSGPARVYDAQTGRLLRELKSDPAANLFASAFSRDGRRVALVGFRSAEVWDVDTGGVVARLEGYDGRLRSAAFSPDGSRVVLAGENGVAQVWAVATGKALTAPLAAGGLIRSVAFSPDGRRLACGYTTNAAVVWDVEEVPDGAKPRERQVLTHPASVGCVSFSPDGSRVLTACDDGQARLWVIDGSLPTELIVAGTLQNLLAHAWVIPMLPAPVVPLPHAHNVHWAAFSRDGKRIVTTSGGYPPKVRSKTPNPLPPGEARVWDTATGRPLTPPLRCGGDFPGADFSPDGLSVVTVTGSGPAEHWGEARLWDLDTAGRQPLLIERPEQVYQATFGPDGDRLFLTGGERWTRGSASVIDAVTGRTLGAPLTFEDGVSSLGFSADGNRLLVIRKDLTVQVWDVPRRLLLSTTPKHPRRVVAALSPDGLSLVTAGGGRAPDEGNRGELAEVRVWDAQTGQPVTPVLQDRFWTVLGVLFSPDGRRVCAIDDQGGVLQGGRVHVWDARTGQPAFPPLAHPDVAGVVFSPDASRLLTVGSRSKEGRLWDATSGRALRQVRHEPQLRLAAFNPEGSRIVTANEGVAARVWDAETGEPVTDQLRHEARVMFAAFTPDGRRVVTGCDNGAVRVWDALSGQAITGWLRHEDYLTGGGFSPDGRRLLVAPAHGMIRVWDIVPDQRPVAELVALAELLAEERIDSTFSIVSLSSDEVRQRLPTLSRAPASDGNR